MSIGVSWTRASVGIAFIVCACSGSATTVKEIVRVEVTVPAGALVRGGTATLRATAWDSDGRSVPDVVPTWESKQPTVATITPSGIVTAVGTGSATIVARVGTTSGSATVNVTDIPAPEPGGSDVILWQDGFESRSTSGYSTRGDIVVINDGHSGSALRFPYTSSSSDNLIEKVFQTSTDVYFRYWYRTSPGMDPTCGDRGGSGMKWFMAWRASGVRYTMGVGTLTEGPLGRANRGNEFASHDNGSSDMPNPVLSDINNNIRLNTTNDGQWHKYTLHIVTANGDGTGYEQIWIDGTLVLDDQAQRYHHNPEGIAMVNFPGLVVNWFAGCDFTIDVDDLAIWHK